MLQSNTAADTTSDPLDRPVLAPATWLVGQLEESALENPPWAVEQPKRGYVEMSELAYRVAEQATGDQTIDEIATAVSTALRRPVSAIDVEALIDTILIPRGVVRAPNGYALDDDSADADDPTPAPDDVAAPAGVPVARDPRGVPVTRSVPGPRQPPGRPPRAARRERIVGPGPLETVASILMWLFWPPVMLVLAGLSLAALVWLFTIHGLARSVIQVLGVPLLLPVTLLVTVLAAAVQRIGPMVALYGGGATIQRLRILPSLRHPIFEVDVADDYGLSRWARLTVNVSGVYLQLVVALLLCIVGRSVGPECLLLAATLLTLNMLRLLLPFGRPGADRLLADWLLVQHPLRYAEQALERYLPGLAPSPRALPPLKRWGRVTIALYLLAVVIGLAIVGLVILRTTPTILATLWVALAAYLSGMAEAFGDRDVVGFIGSLFNAAVLLLMTFCLAVALIVVARRLLARAWTWSQETPRRRLLGGIGAVLLALLLVVCWIPVRGFGANGPPRSLAGIPYRSLNELSRGTLFDLFGEPSTLDASADQPGDRPTVTTDVGSGVGGPLPDAATPSTGSGATTGATNAAPSAGTPAAKPAPIGAETPGPANAGPDARGTADTSQPPAAQGTSGPGDQDDTGPASNPASGTAQEPASKPSTKPTTGTADQPASKPTSSTASKPENGAVEEPAAKPTSGIVVQPVNKPTVGTANQPAAKPSTGASGAAGQPASKPSTQATRAPLGESSPQDTDEPDDALDATPTP